MIDEVESMGTALNQISNLVHAEEQNVKKGLGFKLFTATALSDVRRIEGTILERAGNSGFEKEIRTRRAEFRRHVGGKGKGVGAELCIQTHRGSRSRGNIFLQENKMAVKQQSGNFRVLPLYYEV
ncbi:hypothetical protein UCDDA912_g00543 [Diaporthe ampelina]|uniref:Uncharacterized protein n=1 Tax=Diaporthe ampelina TaxID=1214573 RepID=A0A0G2FZ04_9PEZI|nr:hypothetical protein UCDDA912_g00543 [Diaporthe ampelina]